MLHSGSIISTNNLNVPVMVGHHGNGIKVLRRYFDMNILAQSKPGVYKICNVVSGKIYVGSAVNVKKRLANHLKLLQQGQHHNRHLQSSFNKYGEGAFFFVASFYCARDEIIRYEQILIDKLHPEYNVCLVAGSSLGTKHSEETKRRLSEMHKGTKLSEAHKRAIGLSQVGRPGPQKGKPHSPETKEKIRLSMLGKPGPNKGKRASQETRDKMSRTRTGRKRPPEATAAIRRASIGNKWNVGRKHTPEMGEKIRQSKLGKKHTPEAIEKMRRSHQARWAKKKGTE
jgi:group I intron endonuclease